MRDWHSPLWRTATAPAPSLFAALLWTTFPLACTEADSTANSGTQGSDSRGGSETTPAEDDAWGELDFGGDLSSEASETVPEDGDDPDEGGDDPRFDLGPSIDLPPVGEGCEKVDFLFVIDNSMSMVDEQARLIAAFPDFIHRIQATIAADDYHIMAIDTDASAAVSMCNAGVCQCGPDPRCCGVLCGETGTVSCNGEWCTDIQPAGCEVEWGAGSIHRGGDLEQPCALATGQRYIADDEPNLVDKFSCIAEVGTVGGGDEQPIFSMLSALGPQANQAGACNEGFLRDDALLVVVMITDEDDLSTPEGPTQWHEKLVALKNGDAGAVVVLGFVSDSDLAGGQCDPQAVAPAPRLREFIGQFDDQGISASICQADFGPDFQRSVDWIDRACDIFDPPE